MEPFKPFSRNRCFQLAVTGLKSSTHCCKGIQRHCSNPVSNVESARGCLPAALHPGALAFMSVISAFMSTISAFTANWPAVALAGSEVQLPHLFRYDSGGFTWCCGWDLRRKDYVLCLYHLSRVIFLHATSPRTALCHTSAVSIGPSVADIFVL